MNDDGAARSGDDDWVSALVPGDRDDFELLYDRCWKQVVASLTFVVGSREAAEDCAQEAFARAWKAWPRWRPDAAPSAWVHRIALRVASNHRARERIRSLGETLRRVGRPEPSADPSDVVAGADLKRALAELSVNKTAVMVLRHLHGYSNREIAVALGIPERTVASRLIAARRDLRRELGPDWEPGVSTSSPSPVVGSDD